MRILLFIYALISLTACNSNNGFVIDGVITGAKDGEMICLSYPIERNGIWRKQCDTTYINGEHFRFEGKVDGVVPAELSFKNMDFAELFIEPSEIKFSAERGALYGYSISGLCIDDELDEYRKAFAEYNKVAYQKNSEAMRKNEEWVAAKSVNSPSAESLWSEFYAIVMEHRAISATWPNLAVEFIKSHQKSPLTPYIIDRLISYGIDEQIIDPLIDALPVEQQHTTLKELMRVRYELSKVRGGQVGCKALDFTLNSIDDEGVTLSECYANGYVLLDFWASWCTPCINEIAKIRELHNAIGDKLQIISVSIDDNIADWRDAVEKLHLTEWRQLIVESPKDIDYYYFPEQADIPSAYDIQQIPCFILINTAGSIIGRWPHIMPTTVIEIEQLINSNK